MSHLFLYNFGLPFHDLISLFYVKEESEREKYNSILNEIVTELSKEAKKEIYLKNQDKGYER